MKREKEDKGTMMTYFDPIEDHRKHDSVSSNEGAPAAVLPTSCYGRPDPQVVHVRVSPTPNVFEEGETSQDSAAEEQEKAPPPKWKLTPAEEKMQTLYNFNETALQPKSEFYPADESYSEKLKLLYEEKQVSPCCQHCSPCCSCCSCVIQ